MKQMRAFSGDLEYGRIWIRGYTELATPLYQALEDA